MRFRLVGITAMSLFMGCDSAGTTRAGGESPCSFYRLVNCDETGHLRRVVVEVDGKEACSTDYDELCANFVSALQDGKWGAPKDPKAALPFLRPICRTRPTSGACHRAAEIEMRSGDVLERLHGEKELARLCDEGQTRSCTMLALFLDRGIGTKRNAARSAHYYELACRGDVGPACSNLALKLVRGEGLARDPVKARVLLERACSRGTEAACSNLRLLENAGELSSAPLVDAPDTAAPGQRQR